ncbi:MAG: hypothetical protein GX597_18845 [Anaerolineaceae bacterium]|nr:hypothetical protein [Anaerolineaceae bacterium]
MVSTWKHALRALALAALVLAPGFRPPVPARAEGERLVLAFYYAWYDQNTWSSGKVPDVPSEPYVSSNPEVMARQIDQAKGAGIDAFVLNWWGQGNQTEKNLKALLDQAGQKGFRVAVDFDPNSPFMKGTGSYAQNLQHLLTVHAAHPAYLRYNGRPVVFFYNVSRLGAGTWRSLRDQVDPQRQALWIAEGTDIGYQSVFDGHHLYSITWPNRIPPAKTLSAWGDRVRAYNRDHGTAKLWVATVMPGYDDRKARPGSGFVRGRDGGEYYRECWQAAIASKPQWVIINSFNEWPEGSYVEPSKAYGGTYLDLTREWAGRFRSAEVPAVAAEAAPPPATPTVQPTGVPPTPTPTPTPTPAPTPPPLDELWAYDEEAVQAYLGCGCGYFLSGAGWVILCPSFPPAVQSEPLAY